MKKGWILLHRKIYSSADFRSELDRSIFIFLLCQASYEPVTVIYRKKRISLNRGELLITHGDIAKRFGISLQNVRTVIKNLKLTGTLTVSLTRGLMRISIEKYIKYQDLDSKLTAKLTGSLTDRRKNTNKSNNSNTNIGNIIKMDKIKPLPMKDLKSSVKQEKNEFVLAKERLSKDQFEIWLKNKLAMPSK